MKKITQEELDNMKKIKCIVSAHDNSFYNFALRIATSMDDLKSSHVYFIIQKAFGEIAWEKAQEILDKIMKCNCPKCKKIKAEVRNNLK